MSIAQEHVLGRVVPESQLNNPKIRVMSIKKDNFAKVHLWGIQSIICHSQNHIKQEGHDGPYIAHLIMKDQSHFIWAL
jgi:hypothetical protein